MIPSAADLTSFESITHADVFMLIAFVFLEFSYKLFLETKARLMSENNLATVPCTPIAIISASLEQGTFRSPMKVEYKVGVSSHTIIFMQPEAHGI